MTDLDLMRLLIGDLVRHSGSGETYVVIDRFRKIAVRSVEISNSSEWELVSAASLVRAAAAEH